MDIKNQLKFQILLFIFLTIILSKIIYKLKNVMHKFIENIVNWSHLSLNFIINLTLKLIGLPFLIRVR